MATRDAELAESFRAFTSFYGGFYFGSGVDDCGRGFFCSGGFFVLASCNWEWATEEPAGVFFLCCGIDRGARSFVKPCRRGKKYCNPSAINKSTLRVY